MVPKAPDADLTKDENPLMEAISNYKLLHIEAYVVHVDMVSENEVAFKLTSETIEALTDYHKDVYSVDVSANIYDWSEKPAQLVKLHDAFVQAVNRYVYRTDVRALEGLEEDGAGELLEGRSTGAKAGIMALFLPLLPPPPPPSPVAPEYSFPSALVAPAVGGGYWWPPYQQSFPLPMAMMAEPWTVLGSSPAPTSSDGDLASSAWSSSGMTDTQYPSPSPSDSFWSDSALPMHQPVPFMVPLSDSSLPMPSVVAQQCAAAATYLPDCVDFGSTYQDMMPQFEISI